MDFPISLFIFTFVTMAPGILSRALDGDGMAVDPGYPSDNEASDTLPYPIKLSGGRPADIFFLLDASEGVGKKDFIRSLRLIHDLIPAFDTGLTRIGVVIFNEAVYSMVYIDQYEGSKLQSAIDKIPYAGGKPNLAPALRYLRRKAFSPHHVRPEAAHIAFVVTNGFSINSQDVFGEARRLQKSGVKVFSIYPGIKPEPLEVMAVASEPVDSFLFSINSYFNMIYFIQELLGSKADKPDVEILPTPEPSVCDTRRPADIVFTLDYASIGVKRAKKVLSFVKNAVNTLKIGSDLIHVGLLTNDLPYGIDINLGDHYTSEALLEDISDTELPNQADILIKARRRSFSSYNGARKDVQRTLVLFVDDGMENTTRVIEEASITKSYKINIIVVAVGSRVNIDKWSQVANKDFLLKVDSYDELLKPEVHDDIMAFVCQGLLLGPGRIV